MIDEIASIIAEEPSLQGGPFGLWLRVLIISIKQAPHDRVSREWIFGHNEIFEWLSEELGLAPDLLRAKIRKALSACPVALQDAPGATKERGELPDL